MVSTIYMIDRKLKPKIQALLDKAPAVVLMGPRQVGKTTLARDIAQARNSVYLDLERPSDLAKISDIEAYCELYPLGITEVGLGDQYALWNRGGFPDSFQGDDESSFEWWLDFIRTYLARDIPQLGPRIPAETLRQFWTMLAHNQGQIFNSASFARGLDVKGVTASRYLDLMVDLLLVRRLQQWTSNLGSASFFL